MFLHFHMVKTWYQLQLNWIFFFSFGPFSDDVTRVYIKKLAKELNFNFIGDLFAKELAR